MSTLTRFAMVLLLIGWADPPLARKPATRSTSQPTSKPSSQPSSKPAKKAKARAAPEAEIERLKLRLAEKGRDLERAQARIDQLTEKAETDAKLAEESTSKKVQGSELCSWLVDSPTTWMGSIHLRQDGPSGVELTLGTGVARIPVTIIAKLADGQDLDGLVVGRIVDVKGTVSAMHYSPAGFLTDRKIEVYLEDCVILKKR